MMRLHEKHKMVHEQGVARGQIAVFQDRRGRREEARMIFAAGISFKTAPVALREQLAVTPSRVVETAMRLKEQFLIMMSCRKT